jgi:hypothetical protein
MKPTCAVSIIAHNLTVIINANGFGQSGTREIKERVFFSFFVTKKTMVPAACKTKSRNFAPFINRFRCGAISGTGTRDVCKLRLFIEQESDWACNEIPHDFTSIIDIIQSGGTKLSAGSRNINAGEDIRRCLRSKGVSQNNARLKCKDETRENPNYE